LALAAGFACNERTAYTPTDEDRRLLGAYASLALLYDSFPATSAPDSLALYTERVDSLLREFAFTQEEFRREFENLVNSPERFQPLFQELSAEIRKRSQKR